MTLVDNRALTVRVTLRVNRTPAVRMTVKANGTPAVRVTLVDNGTPTVRATLGCFFALTTLDSKCECVFPCSEVSGQWLVAAGILSSVLSNSLWTIHVSTSLTVIPSGWRTAQLKL